MAKLYGDASGTLIRVSQTDSLDAIWGFPSAAVSSLSFDESSNDSLLADVQTNRNTYSLIVIAGVPTLQKNGTPVTIAAPSSLYSLQSTILNGVPDATLKAAIVALWNGTATTQQQQRTLAYCLLKLKQAGTI